MYNARLGLRGRDRRRRGRSRSLTAVRRNFGDVDWCSSGGGCSLTRRRRRRLGRRKGLLRLGYRLVQFFWGSGRLSIVGPRANRANGRVDRRPRDRRREHRRGNEELGGRQSLASSGSCCVEIFIQLLDDVRRAPQRSESCLPGLSRLLDGSDIDSACVVGQELSDGWCGRFGWR